MAEWEESLHPRASGPGVGGQFTFKSGATSVSHIKSGRWALDADDHKEIAKYKVHDRKSAMAVPTVGRASAAEKRHIAAYTGGDGTDREINSVLRSGDKLNADGKKILGSLDAITARSTLSEDTTLFRLYQRSALDKQLGELKPGDTFKDGGFISTSLIPDAWPGIPQNDDLYGRMIILAPAGSHGAAIRDLSDRPDEHEVILARNSTLEFVGDDEDGTKVFRLRQDEIGVSHTKLADQIHKNPSQAALKNILSEMQTNAKWPYAGTRTLRYVADKHDVFVADSDQHTHDSIAKESGLVLSDWNNVKIGFIHEHDLEDIKKAGGLLPWVWND